MRPALDEDVAGCQTQQRLRNVGGSSLEGVNKGRSGIAASECKGKLSPSKVYLIGKDR